MGIVKHIAFVIVFAIGTSATGQNIHNMDSTASRATMVLSEGVYKACGLRFVGLAVDARTPQFPAYGWDFNLTLYRPSPTQLAAILKTEVSRVESPAKAASAPLVKVAETWLQPEGLPAITPFKTSIPGDNGFSSMSTYHGDDMLKPLVEAATIKGGRALLLGVRLASETATRIYRFVPDVQPQDAAAFVSCGKMMLDGMGRK